MWLHERKLNRTQIVDIKLWHSQTDPRQAQNWHLPGCYHPYIHTAFGTFVESPMPLGFPRGVLLGSVKVGSAPDKPGATYLQMMRHNVTQLAAGMAQNW